MRIRNLQTGASYRPEDMLQDIADGLSAGLLSKDEALQKLVPLAGGDAERLQELMGQVGVEMSPRLAVHFAGLKPPAEN